jgi:serine/threonine protein kinase
MNRYKLGDMGQTQEIDSSSDLDEGDSRYLAPDFLNTDIPKHKRDYKKNDIFSLGMTLYELATSK